MSGFLYQIENRQKEKMQQQKENGKKTRKPAKPDPHGRKTVGVKVDPTTYEELVRLKKKQGLGSIKEAVLVAAREGLKRLL